MICPELLRSKEAVSLTSSNAVTVAEISIGGVPLLIVSWDVTFRAVIRLLYRVSL